MEEWTTVELYRTDCTRHVRRDLLQKNKCVWTAIRSRGVRAHKRDHRTAIDRERVSHPDHRHPRGVHAPRAAAAGEARRRVVAAAAARHARVPSVRPSVLAPRRARAGVGPRRARRVGQPRARGRWAVALRRAQGAAGRRARDPRDGRREHQVRRRRRRRRRCRTLYIALQWIALRYTITVQYSAVQCSAVQLQRSA